MAQIEGQHFFIYPKASCRSILGTWASKGLLDYNFGAAGKYDNATWSFWDMLAYGFLTGAMEASDHLSQGSMKIPSGILQEPLQSSPCARRRSLVPQDESFLIFRG